MNKKILIIFVVLLVLLVGTCALVWKSLTGPRQQVTVSDNTDTETLPPVDKSVAVSITKSPSADNSVLMTIKGLDGKYTIIAYELTYESAGLLKGVNSGSKPVDVSGKSEFSRDIYLGTCSRNVCRPDPGVTKASVVVTFTDASGKRSQFSGDFNL